MVNDGKLYTLHKHAIMLKVNCCFSRFYNNFVKETLMIKATPKIGYRKNADNQLFNKLKSYQSDIHLRL